MSPTPSRTPGERPAKRTKRGGGQMTLSHLFVSEEARNLHGWMSLSLRVLSSYAAVESDNMRALKLTPIPAQQLENAVKGMRRVVDGKIAALLPETIALVLDRAETESTPVLGVFVAYPCDNSHGHKRLMLDCLSVGGSDDAGERAGQEKALLGNVLARFNASWDNVAALVAENTPANRALATGVGKPMVSCAFHRLKLAAAALLKENEDVIETADKVMRKIGGAVYLRLKRMAKIGHLRADPDDWVSYIGVLQSFLDVVPVLPQLEDERITACLPSQGDIGAVHIFLEELRGLRAKTEKLNRPETTLSDVHVMFSELVPEFPCMRGMLLSSSSSVAERLFEGGIAALQNDDVTMATMERDVFGAFEAPVTVQEGVQGGGSAISYMDTRFVVPTCKMLDEISLEFDRSISSLYDSFVSRGLEDMVLTVFNKDLWSVVDVQKLLRAS